MQFAKDMGPTVQLVVKKKLQRRVAAEAFNRQYEIPKVASGHKGIPSVLSLDFLKHSTGSQKFRGKMDIPGDKLNLQKASTFDIKDALSRGFVQTGAYGGKSIPAIGKASLFARKDIHQGIGGPNFVAWNSSSSDFNSLISNSNNNVKNVQKAEANSSYSKENPGNHNRKFVETVRDKGEEQVLSRWNH